MAERERFIQLSDSAERSSLGCLTTGVGVNLSIEHAEAPRQSGGWHLPGGKLRGRYRRNRCRKRDESARLPSVSWRVPTVATDDPLRALHEIVVERLELLADGAALGSALGDALAELRSNLLGLVGILAVGNPLLSESLVLVAGVAVDHLLQQLGHALLQTIGTHHRLLVTEGHTETELAEVLEQGVLRRAKRTSSSG